MSKTPQSPGTPCAASRLVQAYLANGGPSPSSRDEPAWPATWTAVPSHCPACDGPTIADRYLNSRDPVHCWQVRTSPLRRSLAVHPRPLTYPWHDTSIEERQGQDQRASLTCEWRRPSSTISIGEGNLRDCRNWEIMRRQFSPDWTVSQIY